MIYQGVDYSWRVEVSNLGRLRNAKTKHVYKLNKTSNGYLSVSITLTCRDDKKTFRAHRGVAETFIPNPKNLPIVNHKDGVKIHNAEDNLEWCTYSENTKHAVSLGLISFSKGERHSSSVLTVENVLYIREKYIPRHKLFGCRALARHFGVGHSIISNIVNGKRWKHL